MRLEIAAANVVDGTTLQGLHYIAVAATNAAATMDIIHQYAILTSHNHTL